MLVSLNCIGVYGSKEELKGRVYNFNLKHFFNTGGNALQILMATNRFGVIEHDRLFPNNTVYIQKENTVTL